MRMNNKDITPIELSINMETTPANIFRSLTSQTELRKWWAPRVIMSKNTVSFEDGKDIEMQLLKQEKNHMLRYNWRPQDWNEDMPETTITYEIEDMGVSRDQTGEGITLTIIHDGWTDQKERNKQEKIWKMAISCLKDIQEGKKQITPWWENERHRAGYRKVKLSVLKSFIERINKENRGKQEKKIASQQLMKLCQALDNQGAWYLKDNGNEVELRYGKTKIFGVLKNGSISIPWRDLESILTARGLKKLANRVVIEQGIELHIGKSQEKLPAQNLNIELLTQWFIDIIQVARDNEQK